MKVVTNLLHHIIKFASFWLSHKKIPCLVGNEAGNFCKSTYFSPLESLEDVVGGDGDAARKWSCCRVRLRSAPK